MPTGSAANTEENKAFYEGQKSTWASGYRDAAIVVLSREGAEGVDMLMKDTDDDGVTVISSLALHQNGQYLVRFLIVDLPEHQAFCRQMRHMYRRQAVRAARRSSSLNWQ